MKRNKQSRRTEPLGCGLLSLLLLLTGANLRGDQSLNLAWNPSPGPDLAGYSVCYGTNSGQYPEKITVGTETNFQMTGLAEGSTYYFVVTAFNSAGLESDPSNEISYQVPLSQPGAGLRTSNAGDTTWSAGQHHNWAIDQAASAQGQNPGWDLLNVSGTLTITATAEDPVVIDVTSLNLDDTPGPVHDFDRTQPYAWTMVAASVGISGFDPTKFRVDASQFQNFTWGGAFGVAMSGNSLNLTYTPHACAPSETTLGYAPIVPGTVELYFTNRNGLKAVEGITLSNCTMNGTAYGPGLGAGVDVGSITLSNKISLPVGATNLTILATKLNASEKAWVNARVYDGCDNAKQFDPLLDQVTVAENGTVLQVYNGLASAEHFIRLANGQPGLSRVKLVVNGRTFDVNPFGPGQVVLLDLRAAMQEGNQNTIVLLGWGEPGATAEVQLTDRATEAPLAPASKVEPPILDLARVGDQVVLTWLGPANFFVLESCEALGAAWKPVPAPQEEANGFTTVRLSLQGAISLFRLRQ